MCFSAQASFIAGTSLSAIGVVALLLNKDKSKVWLAATPLLFGLQQLSEGFVWLSHTDTEFYQYRGSANKTFLLFAQVLWPFWIPFVLGTAEADAGRRKKMQWLLIIGTAISIILAWRLFSVEVASSIEGHHVRYSLLAPRMIIIIGGVFYLLPTILSFYLSTLKYAALLGTLTLLAYLASRFFYQNHVLSTWCYFSAILSIIIVFMVKPPSRKAALL